MSAFLCYCSCPDTTVATRIAETLVDEHLAACASVLPGMFSVYRWEGSLQRTDEVQLLIKTSAARLSAVIERIRQLHPYQLPEVIAVEITAGLPAYLAWIAVETHEDS